MKGKKQKIIIGIVIAVLILASVICCLFLSGGIAYAAELVDGTLNAEHLYSKYALENYQLDFYVSMSGGWLPWNWGDSIGKSVMYGVYYITDALWNMNTNLSSAVGSMVAEAYNLDFIGSVSDTLGSNLQAIAGVSSSGFSADGLYIKFLPWLILLTGVSVGYHGMMKHETSKALSTLLHFVIVYVVSAAFIAFAPDYVGSINEFSTEISDSMLEIGTKILVPGSNVEGDDSVDIIRDSLFSIQVYKPWLLMQFGTTDTDTIGQERIDNILAVSPSNGQGREEATITEVEEYENSNMSIGKVPARFGNVLLLLIINIVISVFVLLLTGIMLLSQFLFIIFLLFLPISFLVSMIPGQTGVWKKAVIKVFNTTIMRAGISLVITIAFCLSSMVYGMTENYPFLLIGFLQILVFAGIFFKLQELLGMVSMQEDGVGNFGRRMFHRPYTYGRQLARRGVQNIRRKVRHTAVAGAAGYAVGKINADAENEYVRQNTRTMADGRPGRKNRLGAEEHIGKKIGHAAGTVADIPAKITDSNKKSIEKLQDLPTNARYAAYSVKEGFKEELAQSKETRKERQERRQNEREYKLQKMAEGIEKNVPKEKRGSTVENTKRGGAEYKRPDRKGDVVERSVKNQKEKCNDLGKIPKGAVLNRQENIRQEKNQAGKREKLKNTEYRAPVHVAISTPAIHERNGKPGQELNGKTVPSSEKAIRTVEKRKNAKSDMGKLPKGAVLNGQSKPDRRKE